MFTRSAHGSGGYDPTFASSEELIPKAVAQEIIKSHEEKVFGTSLFDKSFFGRLTTRPFRYGDIVRHKDCPNQREMVVHVDIYTVATIVIDNEDDARGKMTEYTADALERVE